MKKIIINLNPAKPPESSPASKTLDKFVPFVLVLLILLAVFNIFFFGLINFFRLTQGSLKKTLKDLQPQVKEVQTAREDLAQINKEKKDYQAALVNDFLVSRVMADAYAAMPINIWLKSFVFGNDSLTLEGAVVQWKEDQMVSLNRFIQELNKKEYFTQKFKTVGLKSYRTNKLQAAETIEFRIECTK